MSMEDLSAVLWQERELLERLLFKLQVQQLVLASGGTRWLAAAAREVEEVLDRVREAELLRGLEVDVVAAELGLEPNPSLQQIADVSAEPWRSLWLDHRAVFTEIAAEVRAMADRDRQMLAARDTTEHLARSLFAGLPGDYKVGEAEDPEGRFAGDRPIGRLDEAMPRLRAASPDVEVRPREGRAAQHQPAASASDVGVVPSPVTDVGIAEVLAEVYLQEVVLHATWGATGRLLQPSLLDFLR
jgi:hypothetical protein